MARFAYMDGGKEGCAERDKYRDGNYWSEEEGEYGKKRRTGSVYPPPSREKSGNFPFFRILGGERERFFVKLRQAEGEGEKVTHNSKNFASSRRLPPPGVECCLLLRLLRPPPPLPPCG